jgi:hypothetical protein
MSSTAESVHAKIHEVADKAREAAPSSMGEAASGAADSLARVRGAAAAHPRRNGLVVALLVLTLFVLWQWSRS